MPRTAWALLPHLHLQRLAPAIASLIALLAVAGCDSEDQGRSDYFTIQIIEQGQNPIGATKGTYYYIPVEDVYSEPGEFGTCDGQNVNFVGTALASAGGGSNRVRDGATQGEGTWAAYAVSGGNQCFEPTFLAEFDYGGVRFSLDGVNLRPFSDYRNIVPTTDDWAATCDEYADGVSADFGGQTSLLVCFWPYEYAPPT